MQEPRPDKCNAPGGSIDYGNSAYRCLVPVPVVLPPIHLQSLSGSGFALTGLLPSAQAPSSAVVVEGSGWNRIEDRASHVVIVPAQSRSSASSAVLSHCDGNDDYVTRGNSSSNCGGSVLKEHDYIGLTEVSSSPGGMHTAENNAAGRNAQASDHSLNSQETDLRLGLGPPDLLHTSDPKAGAQTALSPLKGFGSSQEVVTSANQRNTEKKVNGAKEKIAYSGCDDHHVKEVSTRYDSLETTGSSNEEAGVAVTDDAVDKRSSGLPDKLPSSVWPAQTRRNEEGTAFSTGVDLSSLQAPTPGQEYDVSRAAHFNGYAASSFALLAAKNGVKRAYDEAMAEKRFTHGDLRSCGVYEGPSRAPAVEAQMLGGIPPPAVRSIPDSELKRFSQQPILPQSPYFCGWGPAYSSAIGTYGQYQPLRVKTVGLGPHSDPVADPPTPSWEARSKVSETLLPMERCPPSSLEKLQSSSPDISPQKGQVVGWPPIRSFRKNSLASPPKSVEVGEVLDETSNAPAPSPAGSLFVKVNMDGVPIGRKVDLNAYNGYESLLLALEEMFHRPHAGHAENENVSKELSRVRLINGTDFVLIYEDKDGDWMLVGDVPWGMFIRAVRRLWIMKASDATGLVPRSSRSAVPHGTARSSVCS